MKTFGVYMIVKNEEKYIKRGLESFLKCADEIVVVDTGSSDKTKREIESLHSDKVKLYDMEWPFNFSKARNHAMSLTTSDFVLSMDGDEYFEDKLIETFLRLKENDFNSCNYIELNLENFSEGKSYGVRHGERVVVAKSAKPEYRYCVHEKIYCKEPIVKYNMHISEGKIIHTHDGNLWGSFDTYRQMYYNDLNNIVSWDYARKSHYWYYLYYTTQPIDSPLALWALSKCYCPYLNKGDYDYRVELKNSGTLSNDDFMALVMVNLTTPSEEDCQLISQIYNTVDINSNSFEIFSNFIKENYNKEGLDGAMKKFFESYCLKTYNNMNVLKYIGLTDDFIKKFPDNKIAIHNEQWNSKTLIPRINETMCVIHENNFSPSVIYYAARCFHHVIVFNNGGEHENNISYSNVIRCYSDSEIDEYTNSHNLSRTVEITPNKPIYVKGFSNIFNAWLNHDNYSDETFKIFKKYN